MVAVPDFAAGAMENTAAIFYREADLLADSATASVADAEEHRVDRGARNGAPVVRRSGHDAVVGRPVAERGIRDLDGEPPAGGAEARVEHRGRRGRRDAHGARTSTRLHDHARHSLERRDAGPDRGVVRRHRVRKGRRRPADGRAAIVGPDVSGRASTPISRSTPTATPRPRISGRRWPRRRASRSIASCRPSSISPARRSSRCRSTAGMAAAS